MTGNKLTKVVAVVGSTASGKSDLGIRLAKKFSGEVISADSRQVYRGMSLGTGKVQRDSIKESVSSIKGAEKYYFSKEIRHHLIDVANPKKQFTADDFRILGREAIENIVSRNKIPIIVGGTGFYIDVLLDRMSVAEVPSNKKLRAQFDRLTVEHLFKMLKKLDPKRAKTIEPKNKRRLVRALEIVLTTGKSVPKQESRIWNLESRKFDILWIGLKPKNLEKRIKKRLDERLKQGMIKEVQHLHNPPAGAGISWKRLDDFGLEYRWVSRWLKNHGSQRSQITNPKSPVGDLGSPILDYKSFLNSQEY
ncbi:MAG: tRNA (adenosine(37)-N6)-dimethylallyltransferase MiaA, partial [Patescibacteria group bacterium]